MRHTDVQRLLDIPGEGTSQASPYTADLCGIKVLLSFTGVNRELTS